MLSDRLVVERKGPTDLAASIKDRRLFEQVARLARAYPSVVLIVEGDPVHMHEAAWLGALVRALTLGASVLRTRDAQDTAEWIARLYRLEGKPASEPRGAPRVRRPTEDDLQTAEDVLRSLPGISTVGAGRLLARFGSLERVFAAGGKSCWRFAASARCGHGRWTGCSGQRHVARRAILERCAGTVNRGDDLLERFIVARRARDLVRLESPQPEATRSMSASCPPTVPDRVARAVCNCNAT